MARGQLPKAYLRIDPNIDQTHPDNLDGFVKLLCAANRQPARGMFRSRAVLEALLGKTAVKALFARGDVCATDDGAVVVPGWDLWQEGDLTVGERVRRFRDKHISAVTSERPDNAPDNAHDVSPPFPDRIPASEASRRQGSKASRRQGSSTDVEGERAPGDDFTAAVDFIEDRTGRPWSSRPGSKVWDTLAADLRDFGLTAVTGAMCALTDAHPDAGQLVFGASRLLHPISSPPKPSAGGHTRTAAEVDAAFEFGGADDVL